MTAAPIFSAAEEVAGEVVDADVQACAEPECGETFTGPRSGPGSAGMLLGRHRWAVHGIRKDGTRRPPAKSAKSRPTEVDPLADDHPVAATVAAAGAAVKGTGAPRAEQLARGLGIGLSAVTEGLAGMVVKSDPAIGPLLLAGQVDAQERAAALTAALSVTRETATRIMAPVARILAPTDLNKRVGRLIVENTDLAPAAVELAEVGRMWVQYLAVRRAQVAAIREATAAGPQRPPMPAGVTPEAQQAAAAGPPPPPHVPVDPTLIGAGRVVTATHVPPQQ